MSVEGTVEEIHAFYRLIHSQRPGRILASGTARWPRDDPLYLQIKALKKSEVDDYVRKHPKPTVREASKELLGKEITGGKDTKPLYDHLLNRLKAARKRVAGGAA